MVTDLTRPIKRIPEKSCCVTTRPGVPSLSFHETRRAASMNPAIRRIQANFPKIDDEL
jgi:hypothetical protein